jgi:iron complex transport system ATP-binding protein
MHRSSHRFVLRHSSTTARTRGDLACECCHLHHRRACCNLGYHEETENSMTEKHSHTAPSLSVSALKIGYPDSKKKKSVLEGISFDIKQGELVCLIGANGTGKSTLIKTLSGLIPSVSGKILVSGKSLYEYSSSELSKEISLVLTEKIQDDHLTAGEILVMGRHPYTSWLGTLSDHDWKIIDQMAEKISVSQFMEREFCTLSDGEKQRVMIARALIQEASIILLDEPASFLDLSSRIEIMELLREIAVEEHKTILVSSHDIELAIQYADRLIIITEDEKIFDGFTEDLIAAGVFENIFQKKLSFDISTGKFRIKNKKDQRRVNLEGHGIGINLISHALRRNGFEISPEAALKIMVEQPENYLLNPLIHVYAENKLLSFLSVKELISYLKNETF